MMSLAEAHKPKRIVLFKGQWCHLLLNIMFLQIYPYKALVVTARGQNRLPNDVDRARLEVSAKRPV